MSYDTPLSAAGNQVTGLPWREQLRIGFKDMGQKSFKSAKGFGVVGAMFAGTECCIEGVRTILQCLMQLQKANDVAMLVPGEKRHEE